MYINESVKKLEISIIRQISAKMSNIKNGINMTIGEPGNDIPQKLKDYMADLTKNTRIGYTNTGGDPKFRSAVASYYNKYFGSNYTWKNALANAGSSEGISSFLRTVLAPGDEVILPLPAYPGYEPTILMMNAKPVFIDLIDNEFNLTAEILEKYITKKTKVIILTYPNNPTGKVMPLEEMDKIANLFRKYEIYLLSDEIYAELSFEKYHSFARYQDLIDKIVIVTGMSKSHSMTGYRIGYTLGSEELIANVNKVGQYTMTGANSVGQFGTIYALENFPHQDDVVKMNYDRLMYMKKGLENIGLNVINPDGAFYLFVDIRKYNKDSVDFCMKLLEQTGLGVVPGVCFRVDGFIRITVTKDYPVLDDAINRLKTFLDKEYKR